MKLCPYCAEQIQDAAIKCRHCGEFLEEGEGIPLSSASQPVKWYFKTPFILLMLLTVGPFALPLIWWHPHMSITRKVIYSLIILILSALLMQATIVAMRSLMETYDELMQGGF
jgi:hypothetical protein